MTVRYLNPMLDAKRLNKLLEAETQTLEELVRLGVANLWQSGYLVGEEPPGSKLEELAGLLQKLPQLQALISDPLALEGDRIRAQRELMRLEELRREVFAGAV